jgi:hypothetical protein
MGSSPRKQAITRRSNKAQRSTVAGLSPSVLRSRIRYFCTTDPGGNCCQLKSIQVVSSPPVPMTFQKWHSVLWPVHTSPQAISVSG